MIRLRLEDVNQITRNAETEYPDECCGLILGKLEADHSKTVGFILPVSNARENKDKHNRFLITSEDFMRGEMFARKKQLDVLGFYHSHPDHPAVPSDYDREHAWPIYSYLIISVAHGKADSITSWELDASRLKFNPETILRGD